MLSDLIINMDALESWDRFLSRKMQYCSPPDEYFATKREQFTINLRKSKRQSEIQQKRLVLWNQENPQTFVDSDPILSSISSLSVSDAASQVQILENIRWHISTSDELPLSAESLIIPLKSFLLPTLPEEIVSVAASLASDLGSLTDG